MSEEKERVIISPNICGWADDNHKKYMIEVELPGVDKDTIMLKMHEDSFFLKGETESLVYVGSYAVCCPVKPEEAKATYKNGLLRVEVPFKDPMEDAIDIEIQ
jgi:HSP20 family molecular chaperone IbpA